MKKVIILSFVLVNTTIAVFSQSEKYTAAMKSSIEQYKVAKTPEDLMAVQAKFERIAATEKNQWLPYYYAALIKANSGFTNKPELGDKIADEATALLDKADSLNKNNCEVLCVRSMVSYVRLMVSPMARGMKYSMEANNFLSQAMKADSTNPRPVILKANSLAETPEAYGGGCKKAKPFIEKAKALLASFKPASELHPIWGEDILNGTSEKCK